MTGRLASNRRVEQLRAVGGFTLTETLVVLAVCAVVIAIAIPVFTSQLNKVRVESDAANIRSGYALATAMVLSDKDVQSGDTYSLNADGMITDKNATGDFKTTGDTHADASLGKQVIGGQELDWDADEGVTYVYHEGDAGSMPTIQIIMSGSGQD